MEFALKLPEEILKEVLCYVLYRERVSFDPVEFEMEEDWEAPDFAFSYADTERPRVNASTLLVCKQWYRVGMPLLYESVLIKDTTRLKTLATTLQNRPEIGPKIRRLRLANAFGKDLVTVLELTPNIHTLSICTHVTSRTSVAGLRKALLKRRMAGAPTRLLLESPPFWTRPRVNAATKDMLACIIVLVSNWPELKRIDIGGEELPNWCYTLLEGAEGLEYVGVSVDVAEDMLDLEKEAALRTVKKPGFKNVLCRASQRVVDEMKKSHPSPVADALISEESEYQWKSDLLTIWN
ncbi:hypothetical protein EIP86_001854 [Pleurotus ostreatoroseus]|nr:hypothetical protein EIP86_001854 [Pleurotus ostreatoroseus]